MKIECSCCKAVIELDDADVRAYIGALNGKATSEVKAASCRANASKPRPGALGKKKPRKVKGEVTTE